MDVVRRTLEERDIVGGFHCEDVSLGCLVHASDNVGVKVV